MGCILIITISPSKSGPYTLLSGNWLSKLLHCDKLSTAGSVAGGSPETQTTHLLGGTVCMMVALVAAALQTPGECGRYWLAGTAHCTGSARSVRQDQAPGGGP